MNSKFLIFILCFCFFSTLLFSQDLEEYAKKGKKEYHAYAGLSFGPAIPIGEFGRTEAESGFAKNGTSFQLIDLGFRFYKNLNLSAHYLRLNNPVNQTELLNQLNEACTNCGAINPFQIEASDYELNAALLGLGFVKESNSLSFQMQIMMAYGNVFLPSFNVRRSQTNGPSLQSFIPSKKISTFGFGVGSSIRIHLNERLDFATHATYIIFRDEVDDYGNSSGTQNVVSNTFNYEVISLSFGFAYRFYQK